MPCDVACRMGDPVSKWAAVSAVVFIKSADRSQGEYCALFETHSFFISAQLT